MTFEDAYQKLREGTATDEEAAFVARELENVRRISAILDNPSLSDPGIEKAEVETVQRARRAFNRKTLLRTVVIVVCSLLAIAAIVCAVLFIPSLRKAEDLQSGSNRNRLRGTCGTGWRRGRRAVLCRLCAPPSALYGKHFSGSICLPDSI